MSIEALSVGADRATTSLSLQTKSPGQGNVGSCFVRWETNRESDIPRLLESESTVVSVITTGIVSHQ